MNEAGGHRWQRVPPTERKGRIHTSTVTVAVFEVLPEKEWRLREADIEVLVTKGTGAGGQNRNKRETAIVMRHAPTGIEAKAECERTQSHNKRIAREVLEMRVAAFISGQRKSSIDEHRRNMVGSGMRGDKVRTYREQNDQVSDHRSGKKTSLRATEDGKLESLQ